MVDREHGTHFVHGVAVAGLADVRQRLAGWQLVAEELLGVEGELVHALGTPAHAHELDVAEVRFQLVDVFAKAYVVQEVFVEFVQVLVQIGDVRALGYTCGEAICVQNVLFFKLITNLNCS